MALTAHAVWRPSMSASPVRATAAGKFASVLALACVTAHIPVLVTHLGEFPGTSLLMLALAVACIACVRHLWTGPTVRDWVTTGALAAGMLLLHAMLMLSMTHTEPSSAATILSTSGGHHHGSSALPMETTAMPDELVRILFFGASALALIQVALAAVIVLPVILRRQKAFRTV